MNKGKLLELAGQLMLAGVTHQDEEIEKISEQLAAELRQTEKERGGRALEPRSARFPRRRPTITIYAVF